MCFYLWKFAEFDDEHCCAIAGRARDTGALPVRRMPISGRARSMRVVFIDYSDLCRPVRRDFGLHEVPLVMEERVSRLSTAQGVMDAYESLLVEISYTLPKKLLKTIESVT